MEDEDFRLCKKEKRKKEKKIYRRKMILQCTIKIGFIRKNFLAPNRTMKNEIEEHL